LIHIWPLEIIYQKQRLVFSFDTIGGAQMNLEFFGHHVKVGTTNLTLECSNQKRKLVSPFDTAGGTSMGLENLGYNVKSNAL
jgi:hypothetical protein